MFAVVGSRPGARTRRGPPAAAAAARRPGPTPSRDSGPVSGPSPPGPGRAVAGRRRPMRSRSFLPLVTVAVARLCGAGQPEAAAASR